METVSISSQSPEMTINEKIAALVSTENTSAVNDGNTNEVGTETVPATVPTVPTAVAATTTQENTLITIGTREDLAALSFAGLREVAKQLKIKSAYKLKKAALADHLWVVIQGGASVIPTTTTAVPTATAQTTMTAVTTAISSSVPSSGTPSSVKGSINLAKTTIKELVDYCKTNNVSGYSRMKKEELVVHVQKYLRGEISSTHTTTPVTTPIAPTTLVTSGINPDTSNEAKTNVIPPTSVGGVAAGKAATVNVGPQVVNLATLADLKLSDGTVVKASSSVIALNGQKPLVLLPNQFYIGRHQFQGGWKIDKSEWHNPFSVKEHGLPEALRLYRQHVLSTPKLLDNLPQLANWINQGGSLACWCHTVKNPSTCHGDLLISMLEERGLLTKAQSVAAIVPTKEVVTSVSVSAPSTSVSTTTDIPVSV